MLFFLTVVGLNHILFFKILIRPVSCLKFIVFVIVDCVILMFKIQLSNLLQNSFVFEIVFKMV